MQEFEEGKGPICELYDLDEYCHLVLFVLVLLDLWKFIVNYRKIQK
jgi:uncharacterized membrane protein (DUF373 family)